MESLAFLKRKDKELDTKKKLNSYKGRVNYSKNIMNEIQYP
jgi:hypothetical protein